MVARRWRRNSAPDPAAVPHEGATPDWSPAEALPPARRIGHSSTDLEELAAQDHADFNGIEARLHAALAEIAADVRWRLDAIVHQAIAKLYDGRVSLIKEAGRRG